MRDDNQKELSAGAREHLRLHWDDIRYFLMLAQLGSLSGVARQLGVEHSTVARRVESLEKALAVRLFDRLPKGWVLSSEGELLVTHAQRLAEEAQSFARVAQGVTALQGTVRISAPPVFASQFLVPRLAVCRNRWPQVSLEVIGETKDADLAGGEADLALRLFRPEAPGLTVRLLGEMGYGLYASPGYENRPETAWEFLGYDNSLKKLPQQQWLESVAAGRPFIMRSNDLAAMVSAAKAGLGVAVIPHFLATQDKALLRLSGPCCPSLRQIWLVIHPDLRRSPRVRLLADLIAEIVREGREELIAENRPG